MCLSKELIRRCRPGYILVLLAKRSYYLGSYDRSEATPGWDRQTQISWEMMPIGRKKSQGLFQFGVLTRKIHNRFGTRCKRQRRLTRSLTKDWLEYSHFHITLVPWYKNLQLRVRWIIGRQPSASVLMDWHSADWCVWRLFCALWLAIFRSSYWLGRLSCNHFRIRLHSADYQSEFATAEFPRSQPCQRTGLKKMKSQFLVTTLPAVKSSETRYGLTVKPRMILIHLFYYTERTAAKGANSLIKRCTIRRGSCREYSACSLCIKKQRLYVVGKKQNQGGRFRALQSEEWKTIEIKKPDI